MLAQIKIGCKITAFFGYMQIKNNFFSIFSSTSLGVAYVIGSLSETDGYSLRRKLKRMKQEGELFFGETEEDLVCDVAIEALTGLAAGLVEMDQSLGVGSIVHFLPEFFPLPDDAVILCRDNL